MVYVQDDKNATKEVLAVSNDFVGNKNGVALGLGKEAPVNVKILEMKLVLQKRIIRLPILIARMVRN